MFVILFKWNMKHEYEKNIKSLETVASLWSELQR